MNRVEKYHNFFHRRGKNLITIALILTLIYPTKAFWPFTKSLNDKINSFHKQIDKSKYILNSEHAFRFDINRTNVLQDSYKVVMDPEGVNNMKKMIRVRFIFNTNDEHSAVDIKEHFAREWLSLLSDEISDPENGYFRSADEHNYESEMNPETKSDVSYFKFIGRVVGTAVYHRIVLNVSFVKPYYKTMLGEPITMDDVETGDPTYYKHLSQTNEEELRTYLLTIPHGEELNGKSEEELRMVIVRYKYVTSVLDQMSAFLEGFDDLIPLRALRVFTADELKLVISGTPTIDVDDWKANTKYNTPRGWYVVEWFWQIVKEYDNDKRRRLLQFVTGTSRVPVKGFKNLKPQFSLDRDEEHLTFQTADSRYPIAELCFNELTLPNYSTKELMETRLEMALREENQDITLK